MPRQQHHPTDTKRYNQGANRDLDKELLGSLSEGEYVDAKNMRPNASDGDAAAIEKIFGEEVIHINKAPFCILGNSDPLPGSYLCIGTVEINDHIIEFWADEDEIEDSIIRIDGDVVLKSLDFPITAANPLQIAKNESCIGGEVYITDYVVTPMFFNIQDLIDNKCELKFFDNFNLDRSLILLKVPVDHPVFIELLQVGSGINIIPDAKIETRGGSGLPTGTYQYRIRYVTESGDRTKLSVATPPIIVPVRSDISSPIYPGLMTHGGGVGAATNFRIKIRFRVTNLSDFDFIEVVRIAYNTGSGVNAPQTAQVIAKIDIEKQEISIIDFIDANATSEGEILTDEDETDLMKTIARAKAIRYFNQRLFMMNVEFESREVKDNVGVPLIEFKEGLDNETIYPTIDNIGQIGHRDTYNHTYFKSYMRGEKFGFAIVFFDGLGERTFAIPVKGGENFEFPNRRDKASENTLKSTANGDGFQKTVAAATVDGDVDFTHEVFDLKEATHKNDVKSFISILQKGNKETKTANLLGDSGILAYASTGDQGNSKDPISGAFHKSEEIGFRPLTPVDQDRTEVDGHNIVINTGVKSENEGWVTFNGANSGTINTGTNARYHPDGFKPRYFALGGAIEGIENIPPWVESFAVVRTNAAGKVVTQGLGFYSIRPGEFTSFKSIPASKEPDEFWFHSSDFNNGFANSSTVQNNLSIHQVQLASPLGFFSEWYSCRRHRSFNPFSPLSGLLKRRDTHIDMISYARILREPGVDKGQINTGDGPTQVGFSFDYGIGITDTSIKNLGGGYVAYGKWRNNASNVADTYTTPIVGMGNVPYNIESLIENTDTHTGRSSGEFFKLKCRTASLATPYKTEFVGSITEVSFDDIRVKNWHEPMYITNIIRKGVDVPKQNITEYLETGQYQKTNSIIGKGDDQNFQEFFLVDERPEDCIPENNDPNNPSIDKIIEVEFLIEGVKKYLNVTFKSQTQLSAILQDILINGFFIDSEGRKIEGIFRSSDIFGNRRHFKITIDNVDLANNAPTSDAFVRIRYDNTDPIRFFGGDVTISEDVFAPIDVDGTNGDPDGATSLDHNSNKVPFFPLITGFPYHKFEINPRYYQARTTRINLQINPITGLSEEPDRIENESRFNLL